MLRSFRARIQAVFVSLGLAAIILTGWEATSGATTALQAATSDRLTALRQARVRQLERYFQDLSAHALALAADESVLEALEHFNAALPGLPAVSPREEALVRTMYDAFAPDARSWFPRDARMLRLQHDFLAANPYPAGQKDRRLEGPGAYGRAHARFHPTFHRYQTAFGFYDIFLVDAATQRVVYTVFKEIDFGAPLSEPPARDSALGAVVRQALAITEPDGYVLRDYEPYVPSHGDPAAFIATPVWRAGAAAGVLVMQVSIREINRVMTNDARWPDEGLGRTGQAYVFGADGLLRSDMRLRMEDPERYYEALRRAGTPAAAIEEIRRHGTAILRLRANPDSAVDARGVRMLRSRGRVNVPGLDWRLIAEIEEVEAFAPVYQLRRRIYGIGALIAAGFFLTAAALARSVTRPVRALAEGAARLARRDFSTRLPVERSDELGQLAESFNHMASELERTTVSKEELERLAGRLLTAQEDERRRVARELHDDVVQRVAALAIEAGHQGQTRLKEGLARLSEDIHRVSRSLHPAMLDDLGLAAALENECRAFFERGGPPVELELEGDLAGLPRDTQLVLYRITQEGLRNVLRHAAAENVSLRVTRGTGGVRLTLRDDGRGFDPGTSARGLGLASMEERVRPLGGHVRIQSRPGAGTEVEVRLP